MRFKKYLATAEKIIAGFGFQAPLSVFLKEYYRKRPQMGSTDRRTVSDLVYGFFRMGMLWPAQPLSERLLIAWFLTHNQQSKLLETLRPEWNNCANKEIEQKLDFLSTELGPSDLSLLFPLAHHLSSEIDVEELALSQLKQPLLYIRVRKSKLFGIKQALNEQHIAFDEMGSNCLAFANTTNVNHVLRKREGNFEVQDFSSQQTGKFFKPKSNEIWWDCCAGSGGKSLMLMDQEPSLRLYVSDIRATILENLKNRFKQAKINNYEIKELDLVKKALYWDDTQFDGIIVDAPCSGSGTWGRNPEMMADFNERDIAMYSNLQKNIVENVIANLKPGKALIYITCSVFKEENEEVVQHLIENCPVKLEKQQLIKGYQKQADTLFVARMVKEQR